MAWISKDWRLGLIFICIISTSGVLVTLHRHGRLSLYRAFCPSAHSDSSSAQLPSVTNTCLHRKNCEGIFQYVPPLSSASVTTSSSASSFRRAQDKEMCINEWLTCTKDPKKFPIVGNHQHPCSTNEEDLAIYFNFFSPHARGQSPNKEDSSSMYYMEMGAFDGITESNTIFFDKCLGWEGVLIEPGLNKYNTMIEINTRPYAHKINMAAGCVEDNSSVKMENGQYTDMRSVGLNSSHNSGNAGSPLIDIHCGSLTTYLLALQIDHIHFFSLDVESAELLVLKTLNFSLITVDVIMAESSLGSEKDLKEIDILMAKANFIKNPHKGSSRQPRLIWNSDIFVRKEYWNSLPSYPLDDKKDGFEYAWFPSYRDDVHGKKLPVGANAKVRVERQT